MRIRSTRDGARRFPLLARAGAVTHAVSYAPNMLIKLGAKLVVNAEDVIEELPTPVRAALVKAERPEAEQRNLLAFAALGASEKNSINCLWLRKPGTLMNSWKTPA
jgi:predicted Rossmann fold nucleotide-binding protein DprA/Smf involved in DNA uptake